MQKKLLLFACITFSFMSFAQRETSNWYFGSGAGITFNIDGSTTALTDGKLNTLEGCASISDDTGMLQFYTDGITVYNRNHEVMENGNFLYGDSSSTQSAIIVPKPEDPNILYIFTVDTSIMEGDPNRGFNYSVVDMTTNGGLGSVVEKNINLLEHSAEKITAVVKDCFDKSLWVITLSNEGGTDTGLYNTYHAFEINPTGVVKTAIKTTFSNLFIEDRRGYLKISSDGKKIASANSESGLYIYDFNTDTGVLSNQKALNIKAENKFPYGIEFSPSQQYLYAHTSNNIGFQETTGHSSSLIQFDLNAIDIADSEVVIDTKSIYRGALQLGENGKIYRTISVNYLVGTSYLGVINNPDEKGIAANYVHNAISLEGKNASQGLPPFVQSFFEKTALIKNDEGKDVSALEICEKTDLTLAAELFNDGTYEWQKDGLLLANTANTYNIATTTEKDSGVYSVTITFSDPSKCPILGESFITVNPLPSNETITVTQCDVETPDDGIHIFNLDEAFYANENDVFIIYETEIDRTNDKPIQNTAAYVNTVSLNQTLYYKSLNKNGCENFGELRLVVNPSHIASAANLSFYACDTNPNDDVLESDFNLDNIASTSYNTVDIAFYTSLEDLSLEKNEINGSYTTTSTTVYARLEQDNQCLGVDKIDLTVNPAPSFEFPTEFLWCTDGEPLAIIAPDGFDYYSWSHGGTVTSEDINIEITEIGNYILEVGYEYTLGTISRLCTNSIAFTVKPSNKAIINDVIVNDISTNNTVEILASGDGNYEFSINGEQYQDSNLFSNVAAGFISIYVRDKNGCGITEQSISVVGYPSFFTPNGDTFNDNWQLQGVDKNLQSNTQISIFDRYGQLVSVISGDEQGWDGNFNNSPLPATDYWFNATLGDGRIVKGHFALKR